MGDGASATNAGDDRNNDEELDLAGLLSRSGRRAPIDDFIFALRCPDQFAKLPEQERQKIEAANTALRDRFSREVLALIVVLQERILAAHGSRRAFIDRLQDRQIRELNTTFLSRRLGGSSRRGPHGAWWLPELIAEHCARAESPQGLRRQFARLWHTAYGEIPERVLRDLSTPLDPLSEQEIALLIDPPKDVPPAHSGRLADTGTVTDDLDIMPLVDALPDPVLFVDSHGTIAHSNIPAQRLFDDTRNGLAGRGLLELLPSFDINRLPSLASGHDQESTEEGQSSVRVTARCLSGRELLTEVHTKRLTGARIHYEHSDGTEADEFGSSYLGDELLMVVVRNLTGLQELETELARQQRQTELILRTASEGIIRVNETGQITLANAAAAAALGYQPSELGGLPLPALIRDIRADHSPQPYDETPVGQALTHRRASRLRGQVLRASDGRSVHVDLSAAPLLETEGGGAVIAFTVRQSTGRVLSSSQLTAEQALVTAQGESARLRDQVMEYHQLLTQILARLDEPDVDTVDRLSQGLPNTVRNDLLREARTIRNAVSARPSALTLNSGHGEERPPPVSVPLDTIVRKSITSASTDRRLAATRFLVHAAPTRVTVDETWLAETLAQLITAAVGNNAIGETTVMVSAALRGETIRIDASGPFTDRDSAKLATLADEVQTHGGAVRTVEPTTQSGNIVVLLEIPQGADTERKAADSRPPDGSQRAGDDEPKTQATLTTRVHINIPGSRPLPPMVLRNPLSSDGQPHPLGTAAQPRKPVAGPSQEERHPKTTDTQQPPMDVPNAPAARTSTKATPPALGPLTSDFDTYTPPTVHTVDLVSGDFQVHVHPVELSEIEVCRPGERPGQPEKLTAADRAETDRAAKPPGPPAQPWRPRRAMPLLQRQKERERLVRLLARGRSMRVTGPAGSGRTSLLNLVAEDLKDIAPDGVVHLSGFHRTASELLYDLFHAVYNAPLHRPEQNELLEYVREIGAVVVLDDIEFGSADLDELLDATPECAFVIGATPDVQEPSPESGIEEVVLGGLDRAGGVGLLERAVGRVLTEEETNWAGDIWFESEGLPLRFVQAGALLRQRDQLRFGTMLTTPSDTGEIQDVPLPSLGEAAAAAPLLASRLSAEARATLRFAIALGGEVPQQAHLPALIGDTLADSALGELEDCGLVSAVGSRFRLAAGVLPQLEAAGYGNDVEAQALTAAHHYTWWAGHPTVTPDQVCAEADALLAALGVLVPGTTTSPEGEESVTVQLARTAAPRFAAGLHWGAWKRALQWGAEASRLAGEESERAYFHHELGILALCEGQLDRARAELESSIELRGALSDKRGKMAGRGALAIVANRTAEAAPSTAGQSPAGSG